MNSSQAEITPQAAHLNLGKFGEEYAAAYLELIGYRLVAANFTLPVGRNLNGAPVHAEIDIVAYDGPCLCFVEVKTRASSAIAPPQVNVDRRKRRQISRAARAYRQMFALEEVVFRYDVVTVILSDTNATPEIELLRNFWRDEPRKSQRFEHFYD
jgi:putative endonuclease